MTDANRFAADPLTHDEPDFSITHDTDPSDVLVAGFSSFGLAGLTAVDYLVDRLDLEETGHITVDSLPSITPFENGQPRHHTRFFSRDDLGITVLTGELYVPQLAADALTTAITDWTVENDVREIAVPAGIPLAHGPDAHRTFYIATPDYREKRLADHDIPPMGSGFLDGVNAGLLEHAIDTDLAAATYVTPVHAEVPDVDASLRLLDTLDAVYDLDLDTEPLEQFAKQVHDYYAELNARVEDVDDSQRPEDRMYM